MTDMMVMYGYAADCMKPCPFCLGTTLEVRRARGAIWFHYVTCVSCGAEGPHVKELSLMDADAKEACERWNARA